MFFKHFLLVLVPTFISKCRKTKFHAILAVSRTLANFLYYYP